MVVDYLGAIGAEHTDRVVAVHAHTHDRHVEVIEQFETEHDGIGFVYDSGV
ncbi:MAG: hypothetical protein J07HX64_01979 [halophilic archaeon J07HX64]|nr:MAG: hypothetical protein J07HX64_01979 [halophilic archaeon J07HX64]